MRKRLLTLLILGLVVTIAACRNNAGESTTTTGAAPDPGGLLVVGWEDTSIFTIKPDGSDRADLVEDTPGLAAIQPTWSPDGGRLVWTEVNNMSEVPEVFIVTAGPRREGIERAGVPVAPFYYYWSPIGDRVAFLAGGPGGSVELGILDGEARFIGEAQPYYFAWAPDGKTLLTHTDQNAIALVATDGTATTLEQTAALFQAPQWAADGTRLVYATGTPPTSGGVLAGAFQSNGQEIVLADTAGTILRGFGTFAGVATFELSPDGQQMAQSVTVDRKTFNFGPLVVTDIETGNETTVSREPVLAFQWSPAGNALLYLAAGEGIDHPTFRWAVWDGASSTEYAAVTPTPTFANAYLPFWDQYSRSHSLWAPDGSAFAYTGMNEGNDPIVWVQKVGGDTAAEEVASGDVVFWSPAAG
jgi:TolB protein